MNIKTKTIKKWVSLTEILTPRIENFIRLHINAKPEQIIYVTDWESHDENHIFVNYETGTHVHNISYDSILVPIKALIDK